MYACFHPLSLLYPKPVCPPAGLLLSPGHEVTRRINAQGMKRIAGCPAEAWKQSSEIVSRTTGGHGMSFGSAWDVLGLPAKEGYHIVRGLVLADFV